jgi:hypothetical protein
LATFAVWREPWRVQQIATTPPVLQALLPILQANKAQIMAVSRDFQHAAATLTAEHTRQIAFQARLTNGFPPSQANQIAPYHQICGGGATAANAIPMDVRESVPQIASTRWRAGKPHANHTDLGEIRHIFAFRSGCIRA